MKHKVMVIGAGGNIGLWVARGLEPEFDVIPVVHDYTPPGLKAVSLDITNPAATERVIGEYAPDTVVNLAAIADADYCEKHPDVARAVNVEGAANIARACAKIDAYLIQYSTDLVFDGRKGMYTETDAPNPLNVYATTKLLSEQAALSIHPRSAVLRTAIVYGIGSGKWPSFFESVINKVQRRETVRFFTDQYRAFMYVEDSPTAITAMITHRLTGVYHAGADERTSRYDFMTAALRGLGLSTETVEPMRLSDLPGSAPRPADCSLDNSRLKNDSGWRPSSFDEGVMKLRKVLGV